MWFSLKLLVILFTFLNIISTNGLPSVSMSQDEKDDYWKIESLIKKMDCNDKSDGETFWHGCNWCRCESEEMKCSNTGCRNP